MQQERFRPSPARLFRFPWGEFEYISCGTLHSQYRDIFVNGQYAFECSGPAPVIIDCGGNIGLSAVWFKQNYPDAVLTVYEADPAIAGIARRNLDRAGFTDVALRPEAVWVEDGEVGFNREGGDRGAIDHASNHSVRAVSLAERLPERVDLLKFDIEGAEFPVLNHLCDTGAIDRVRKMVAEFHILRDAMDSFLALLQRLRASNMEIALGSAMPSPYFGRPAAAAPFGTIRDQNVLCEVYAWRSSVPGDGIR